MTFFHQSHITMFSHTKIIKLLLTYTKIMRIEKYNFLVVFSYFVILLFFIFNLINNNPIKIGMTQPIWPTRSNTHIYKLK